MCNLCQAEQVTPWFGHNRTCWVALCSTCDVPMVVLWRHSTTPTRAELQVMQAALEEAAIAYFGSRRWYIDVSMNSIPDHFHMHARAE